MKRWSVVTALVLALMAGCGGPPTTSENFGGQGTDQGGGGTTAETTEETTTASIAGSPELEAGAERYGEYVVEQSALLTERTEGFTDAVIAGDVEEAKKLYAPARIPWERIEPIAAKLGDYDPNIDAREGDVPDDEWRGFHRIEKALWEEGTTDGQEEYARRLLEDVENLEAEISDQKVEPVDLVTGSVELLNEVSASKITGEEERYSHTDLYDIQANVEGSEATFDELKEPLRQQDPTLTSNVEQRFDSVYVELEPYRAGEGWVSYTELSEEERRALSQKIDALAEPLSQVVRYWGAEGWWIDREVRSPGA